MKILFATFDSREDFLGRLEVEPEEGSTLTVDTKAEYDDREEVILEIGFPGLPNRILIRAEAMGPDGKGCQQFRLHDEEEDKRRFLIAVAEGTASASWKRKHRRFPMRLPARFVMEEQASEPPLQGDAEIEDLGSGGVALRTTHKLPDGAKVTVVLDPLDGGAHVTVAGKVIWNRGDAPGGVGIQFDSLAGDDMRRLRQLLRDAKLRGETIE